MWDSLGIGKIIQEATKEEDRNVLLERSIFLMVANRCLAPQSKLGCYERWKEDIYFPEGKIIELLHLCRAMDFLDEHKEKIEEAPYWRLADLLSMDFDLVFYDTTSVHFETDEEDGDLRKRGYSKNTRPMLPRWS